MAKTEMAPEMEPEVSRFERFVQKCREFGYIRSTKPSKTSWKEDPCDPHFEVRWITGGVEGGSCWNSGENDPHQARESEPEADFEGLDALLGHFVPNITLLQYRRLGKLIKRTEDYQNDYYGNHTTYGVKTLQLQELYRFLLELGPISAESLDANPEL